MERHNDLPQGYITYLFTDIEGSVKLWEEDPEAMRLALARHDVLLRESIEAHHGIVFKTAGDAFHAAFVAASDALAAALTAQRALYVENWRTPFPIKARIALHSGKAELRDNDYYGPTLNRLARLLAIGHGGQVLLSEVVWQHTRDSLPPNAALRLLGAHRLRDLALPEQVFQLLHPDLSATFPPLKSLNSPEMPNNLPQQTTSFIGREREIKEIEAQLAATRLLTLTGTGGCGKTRLVLQVAANRLEDFPDGVWMAELAALHQTELVMQTVAQILNARETAGQPMAQTLAQALKSRCLLLILDNCEHLINACAQLAELLLRGCPNIKILASSREALGIGGEMVYRVPSLSLPGAPHLATPQTLEQFESARLFIERAAAVTADFQVTQANAPALASVCHRLDGIPLAIELAAARVRVLPVEQIATRLDDRFRLLTGGSRTALPRQQTLRALIDWSYSLLTEAERALLGRLSVFAGGWTLDAAEAVCSNEGKGKCGEEVSAQDEIENRKSKIPTPDTPIAAWEVLDLLMSLVDKSLVVYELQGKMSRYRLLETVRQYAREKLMERGEAETIREAHRDYYLAQAEEAEPQLIGPEATQWLHRVETEHDNLRAALTFSRNVRDDVALKIAGAIWRFWEVRGYLSEGRQWLAVALAAREKSLDPMARVKALNGAGRLALVQSDYVQARELLEVSLEMAREQDDKRVMAFALNNLGNVAFLQSDYATAKMFYEETLVIHRETGDKRGLFYALGNLGNVANSLADFARAGTVMKECLALARELGDQRNVAHCLGSQGMNHYALGEYEQAQRLILEALTLHQELGDKHGMAANLDNLGFVVQELGDWTQAKALHEQSLALCREIGDRWDSAYALRGLGAVAYAEGDFETARRYLTESLMTSRELGDRRGVTGTLEGFARLDGKQQPERAARLWGATSVFREAIGSPLPQADLKAQAQSMMIARSALGEAAFTPAFEAGKSLTEDEAVALALQHPVPTIPS